MGKYDSIRPYNDAEVAAAMKRLAGTKAVAGIEKHLFPDKEPGYLANLLPTLDTVESFQVGVMKDVIARIIHGTTNGLTIGGIENLRNPDGSVGTFLLLSTHRDIVLDPAFIQYVFHFHNLPCTEIAVGDNLITEPMVEDMIRSNRMIKVVRSSNPREVYESSKLLSEYIRESVVGGRSSVWLAHRQGRTKDGHDSTEQGLLKMLTMSGSGDFMTDFSTMPIVPVAISYEYESCGALKALELYQKEQQGFYKKEEGEDINSMISGIVQYKGRIHIEFTPKITIEELNDANGMAKNDKFRRLAEIIDERLNNAYRIWPTNYIAADMLTGGSEWAEKYSAAQKEEFIQHIEKESAGMPSEVKERLLKIYAAHIINA